MLARALWLLGERRRSVALVEEARAVFAAENGFEASARELDAWLASHRP